jgi:hypothetical protein
MASFLAPISAAPTRQQESWIETEAFVVKQGLGPEDEK